jgi:hypothetical protein
MKKKALIFFVRVLVKVINAIGIKKRGSTFDSMDQISFSKEEFCQIGAILPCYSSD